MNIKRFRFLLTAAVVMLAFVAAAPLFAQSNGGDVVVVQSNYGYSTTLNHLEHAIKSDGLMVLGKVNQKSILSMTGLNLKGAYSFLVGNPRVGKKLFGMDPAVTAVIPGRISVWVRNGTTYVGYFKPAALMGMVDSSLTQPGAMLNKKFKQIVDDATK